jgi:hypothetical protein
LKNEGQIGPGSVPTDQNPPANADGGNGGVADNSNSVWPLIFNHGNAYGGDGGNTIFFGSQVVENTCDGRICSGKGGYANSQHDYEIRSPGTGGLLMFNAPTMIQNGILTAGCDGTAIIEPLVSWLNCGKISKAKDVLIFGGDDWALELRPDREQIPVEADRRITVAMGQGGVLDLRGAESTVFRSEEVIIYSDNILLREGMELEQLVEAGRLEIYGARILQDVRLNGTRLASGQPGQAIPIKVNLLNNGPTEDLYSISYANDKGWPMEGPEQVSLQGLSHQELDLMVILPRGVDESAVITIKVRSLVDPEVSHATDILVRTEATEKFSKVIDNQN